jgi:hypothetical protein
LGGEAPRSFLEETEMEGLRDRNPPLLALQGFSVLGVDNVRPDFREPQDKREGRRRKHRRGKSKRKRGLKNRRGGLSAPALLPNDLV